MDWGLRSSRASGAARFEIALVPVELELDVGETTVPLFDSELE